MDFSLSEEQKMFRAMFEDFSTNEIAPIAEEIDHEEMPPVDVLKKAACQGFLGATLPEEHFGASLDFVSYALLIEALARDCVSVAVTLGTHISLVAMSILDHGSDAQKEEFLPLLASGEAIGAFAMTEPDAGSDTTSLEAKAVVDGEGYVLDGVKTWVANGEIANAGMDTLFLVFAEAPGGITAFLIPSDTSGLTVGYREPTLGLRSVPFHTLYLEGCRVPPANRLGDEGEGREIAERARQRMAITLGAAALGVSDNSVDVGAQFATERVQFDVPIAEKQAIQNFIAESAVETEALRYLVYHGAWQVDQGEDLAFDASVVKAFGARVARSVTDRMVQVMGGYGYMEDYPMARKYRDARALGIIGGPTEVHNVLIAKNVFSAWEVEITP
ncbi:MAG: acyl-CoA dehydrogenase family protein [Chloroflexota bacterium]|nr:acyl-CoA dehydrogenase family protein [Chloroflexota bacterium]